MRHPVPLDGFIQVALVVEDIEAALDGWCAVFGVPRPPVHTTQTDQEVTYRGEPAGYGLKLAVIDCADRGFIIELHEPDQNPSTFREFLDRHGNGVHHLGFQVGDARDAIVGELADRGHTLRTVAGDRSWTIIDTEDQLGVNLNLKPRA